MVTSFTRPILTTLLRRLAEPRRFIQVLAGPRQVGKTTLARELLTQKGIGATYGTADGPTSGESTWIAQQWGAARLQCRPAGRWLLVLDEVQKIPRWSETVKRLWDEDTANGLDLRILILGSSPLLMQQGLTESLAGRFETLRVPHWSYAEMREAFGWNAAQYIYFGGYPGAATLIDDEDRWRRYLLDSLIETTISRDILLMTRVDKPALLRRLFQLGCNYSGQILSYQKMIGQLQDAGNTTTLAHYLELLAGAGMLCGLPKFAGETVRQRASSPKLQALNNGLVTALAHTEFHTTRQDPERWGRLVESAIGAHLVNASAQQGIEVFYWREASKEVDFVLRHNGRLVAIEVKSGRRPDSLPGMVAFDRAWHPDTCLLVGDGGIPVEEFLAMPPSALFG